MLITILNSLNYKASRYNFNIIYLIADSANISTYSIPDNTFKNVTGDSATRS